MNGIRISGEQVRRWEKRLAEIEAEAQDLREALRHVAELSRRMRSEEEGQEPEEAGGAAETPMVSEDGVDGEVDQEPSAGPDFSILNLPDAIRSVLGGSDRSLSHDQIRRELSRRGFPESKFGVNQAYYYTVIKRLMRQGDIKKRAKKFRISK